MSALRRAGAACVAAASIAGIVLLSQVPYRAASEDEALIRLSWRAVGERVEECRAPTPEELAALPRHMRLPEICEGRIAPFRLELRVDGERLFDGRIRASGARQDRPTYVFEEFRLSPGEHRVQVRFEVERAQEAGARPAPLLLDETLRISPRQVVLITHDENAARLELRAASG